MSKYSDSHLYIGKILKRSYQLAKEADEFSQELREITKDLKDQECICQVEGCFNCATRIVKNRFLCNEHWEQLKKLKRSAEGKRDKD